MKGYFYKDRDWYYFRMGFSKLFIMHCKNLHCSYNAANKEWYVQENPSNRELIKEHIDYFSLEEVQPMEVERLDKLPRLKPVSEMISKQDIINFLPELNLKKQLRTYQIDAIYYLANHGNCINGSSVGTGKTITSIFYCELLDLFPCIVVCPNSVKKGWMKEWKECNPKRSISIISAEKKKQDFSSDVIIINYDSLGRKFKNGNKYEFDVKYPILKEKKAKLIIADEVPALKNPKSNRSKAFKILVKDSLRVIGLSGTLIFSRPNELLNILQLLNRTKDIAPDFYYFSERYCNAKRTPFGLDVKGASNINELHEILKHYCYFRIEKRDALQELPPIQEQLVECEIDNKKIYNEAEKDFIQFLELAEEDKVDSALKAQQLVKIEYLKQLSLDGKMKSIIEFLKDWQDDNENEKLIIFGIHTYFLTELSKTFKNSVLITSETKSNRDKYIDTFKKDSSCQFMFANMNCLGTGVDGLQKVCSCMSIIEFPSKPSDLEQVVGRLDRSEQKNSVTVYYLLSLDTIDFRFWKILNNKKNITDVVNKGYIDDMSLILINNFHEEKR